MSLMSRNTSNSGSFRSFLPDRREGLAESLLVYAWMPGESDGEFGFDWYVLNVKTGEIRPTLSRTPPVPPDGSAVVSCGNHIYVLGGLCSEDSICTDGKKDGFRMHNCVFHLDMEHPDIGWERAPPMFGERFMPSAIVLKEKIYVFRGSGRSPFAQVFDIRQNIWAPLAAPSASDVVNPLSVSYPVVVDSCRSRILVHFACNRSLYAYYVDDKSWECLNENFGEWSSASVVVDDVLYSFFKGFEDIHSLSAVECSLRAYDVVENKELPTKWKSEYEVGLPSLFKVFHLGNGYLFLAWYQLWDVLCTYIIRVSRNFGEVYAFGESESFTPTPFEANFCLLTLL